MPKLTLSDVTNLGGNPISAQQVINTNSDRIEAAMEKTLSRDGSTPNQMESDFDMNHYDILNAAEIHGDKLFIDGVQIEGAAAWISGPSAPSDSSGKSGDFYLDELTGDVYGPKQGTWGDPVANIKGLQGIQGPQGPVGPQGIQGIQGLTGPQGSQGPRGLQGVKGDQGPQGPVGDAGAQGIQGVQGPTGAQGVKGDSFSPNAVGLAVDRSLYDTEPQNFSFLDTENGFLYFKKSNTSGDWTSGVAFTAGPQGPVGPQGIQGVQGLKGDKGDKGDQGLQGIQGVEGPQGPQGIQGNEGPQGIQGPAGAGVATGGTSGQILTKNSATDFDTSWQDVTIPPNVDIATRNIIPSTTVPVSITYLRTAGYASVGDGGGALYKRVALEPSHAGKVQSADGAWWELLGNKVSGLEFGLVVDDSTKSGQNSSALNEALVYLSYRGGGVLELPCGHIFYNGISFIELRGVTIRGASNPGFWNSGKGVLLVKSGNSGNHFELIDPAGVEISNLAFSYENTPVSGVVIIMRGTGGAAVYNNIKNIYINDHYNGILVEVGHISLTDLGIYRGKGNYGIRVNKPSTMSAIDLIKIAGVILDTQISGGSSTYTGIFLGDNATTWIDNTTCMQCNKGYDIGNSSMFTRITNSDAENCKDSGFVISNARKVWIVSCYAHVNWGVGIRVLPSFEDALWIDKCTISLNGSHGVILNNTGGIVSITNSQIADNSHPTRGGTVGADHGVVALGGVGNYKLIGNRLGGDAHGGAGVGSQGYGWLHNSGTGGGYMISNNDARGNNSGGLSDGGTGSDRLVVNNIG